MGINNRGQSLFEVLVSVAIAALLITGLVSLVATLVRNSTQSKNIDIAARYAQEATEWLREERDKNPSAFFDILEGTKSLGSDSATDGITTSVSSWTPSPEIEDTPFSRTVEISKPDSNTISAVITVSWTDGTITHETKTTTRLTRWQ